ncbi:MAG: SpoIIE family protein phosphatase [Cyanobacteria bacterium P01_D01_bin.105]
MDRVLVIEDEAINQLILKQTLSQEGYEVAVASNGKTGLALAQRFSPMLIICDWMMPQMNGLEVCQAVKSDADMRSTFFILLTARSELQDRVDGLDAGADDFLNKPIQPPELLARVRAGLRIYHTAQSLRSLTAELQAQQQKLSNELTQAATYVTSLLPPPLTGKVEVTSQFLPSAQLGGDCFDFYWLDDDHLVIYVLDVSGHGLGAALPSVSMQQVLRSQSLPNADFYDPSSVLSGLNNIFQMSSQNPRFLTIWYGLYQHSAQRITYASAGHPPALRISPNGDSQLIGQLGQLPIGLFPDTTYQYDQCDITSGSVLYTFSDGLYEIQQADGSRWDYNGLIKVITQLHQQNNQQKAVPSLSRLLDHIRRLKEVKTFDDDCSIVQMSF